MPPVFGPWSSSHRRLWSRAAGSAIARVPSQIAMTLASRPASRSSTTSAGPVRRPSGEERAAGARSPARAILGHDHALARGEPVGLEHRARAGGVQVAHVGARPRPSRRPGTPGRAAVRTPAASATSWQNAFDVSSRAASPVRAEDGDPGRAQRVGDARAERRLRSDDDQLRRVRPRQRDDRRRVERVDGRDAHVRLAGDRRAAGRDQDLVDARLAAELPGEGVLATAAAEHEHPGRHDERHATLAHAGRRPWRSGPPRALDRLGPLGPDRDEHDRDARRAPRARTRSAARSRAGRPGCGRRGSAAPSPRSPRRSARRARARCRSTARRRRAGRRSRRRRTGGSSRRRTGCRAC